MGSFCTRCMHVGEMDSEMGESPLQVGTRRFVPTRSDLSPQGKAWTQMEPKLKARLAQQMDKAVIIEAPASPSSPQEIASAQSQTHMDPVAEGQPRVAPVATVPDKQPSNSRAVSGWVVASRARAAFEANNANELVRSKEKEMDSARKELQIAIAIKASTAATVDSINQNGDMAQLFNVRQKAHAAAMKADLMEATVMRKEAEVERLRLEFAKSMLGSDLQKAQDEVTVAHEEVADLKVMLQHALTRDTAKAEANDLLRAEVAALRSKMEYERAVAERERAVGKEIASDKLSASVKDFQRDQETARERVAVEIAQAVAAALAKKRAESCFGWLCGASQPVPLKGSGNDAAGRKAVYQAVDTQQDVDI